LNTRDPKLIAILFNECINNQDLQGLSDLMTEDHLFVDRIGKGNQSKEAMTAGWRQFFETFPAYRNTFLRIESHDENVVILGHAYWSEKEPYDPVIWTAVIKDDRVSEWRIYDDTPANRKTFHLNQRPASKSTSIPAIMIAACGMNCGVCAGFLRSKNRCPGCNIDLPKIRISCKNCRIKNCPEKQPGNIACYDCRKFPCRRLRQLDTRYRTKYGMSMIDNLLQIKALGIDKFMEIENTRWVCSECGYPVCVHDRKCYHCGKVAVV